MATNIPMNTLGHVTYKGTELNEFSVAGCEWRKPYNLTIPTKPTGVGAISVVRNSSQSNCGQISATTLTASGKVLYGDKITVSATAATGYESPSVEVDGDVIYAPAKQEVWFPLVIETVSKYTSYTNGEVTYYIARASDSSTVSNLSDYTTCTIDGIEVGATSTTIKSTSNAFGDQTTTYSATFGNGVLTLTTDVTYTLTSKPIGTTKVTGDGYSTTATLIQITSATVTGDVTLKVTAGGGKTYHVYYQQGTASTSDNLPSTQTYVYPNSVILATNNMSRIGAKESLAVTLNYNGSGASDTVLFSNKHTSYIASGWTTTNGSATCTHRDGLTYSGAGDLTLYPCFIPETSFGSITLPTPTRTGYVFQGWATSSTATSGQYSGGANYTPTGKVTLYAVWSLPQLIAPEIISATMKTLDGAQTSMQASLKVQNNNSCSVYYRVTWESNDGTGVFDGPYTGSTISIGANSTQYVTGMTNASGVTYSIYFVCDGYLDSEAVTGTVGSSGSTEETTTTTTA